MANTPEEGIIRFTLDYTPAPPDPSIDAGELSATRRKLWRLGLIGQTPGRYDGIGYGNVSQRIGDSLQFIVSGSQTGAIEWLGPQHYARVTGFDCARNRVTATGPLRPSSESLTHAMLYQLDNAIRVVLHVHSPEIWKQGAVPGLPATRPEVEYGTPDMAQEVARLFRECDVRTHGLFVMSGHRDGVVAFGDSVQTAERILLDGYGKCRR